MLLLVFYYCVRIFSVAVADLTYLFVFVAISCLASLFQGHVCFVLKNVKRMQYSLNYSGTWFLSTES